MSGAQTRVTLRDVARLAGVSVSQASFALNGTGRVAPLTIERVRSAADELSYRPDARARGLRTGRSGVYGVVIRNMRNPYFLDVLRGMELAARDSGASLIIISTDYEPEREEEALRSLRAQGVSGVAISPIGDGERLARWLAGAEDVPVVAFNCSRTMAEGVSVVGPDDEEAVALALRHLRARGHDRVALVAAPAELVADPRREDTFLTRCAEEGIDGRILRSRLRTRDVETLVHAECDAGAPPAFLLNSDYLAAGVYRAARERGLVVGRDVSVIGHDDLPTSALLDPPLTTIALDREGLGRAVVERLVGGSDAVERRFPVSLRERGSVASVVS